MKKCTKCGEEKLIDEFNKNGKNKDGSVRYKSRCKVCVKEYNEEYYKENKEYYSEYQKKRYDENKEYYFIANHKRKALKRLNGGSYTVEQLQECLEFFDYKCAYSGEDIELDLSNFHREHIVPISKGGASYIWNICISVDWVNLSKHNSDMEEWYRKQSYFSEERLSKVYQWIEYAKNKYGQAVA